MTGKLGPSVTGCAHHRVLAARRAREEVLHVRQQALPLRCLIAGFSSDTRRRLHATTSRHQFCPLLLSQLLTKRPGGVGCGRRFHGRSEGQR